MHGLCSSGNVHLPARFPTTVFLRFQPVITLFQWRNCFREVGPALFHAFATASRETRARARARRVFDFWSHVTSSNYSHAYYTSRLPRIERCFSPMDSRFSCTRVKPIKRPRSPRGNLSQLSRSDVLITDGGMIFAQTEMRTTFRSVPFHSVSMKRNGMEWELSKRIIL